MRNPIKLKRATLFDCTVAKNSDGQDINVANLVGNKVFVLDPISRNLELFKMTIETNIIKKLVALESDNLAKKETKLSALENLVPLPVSKGPKPKAVIFGVDNNNLLEEIINSSSEDEFKQKSIELANSYVNSAKNPKGILGFVIFELKINRRTEKFISILIADYKGILSSDSSSAVKFLDKVFDENFRDIIFYPHLVAANEREIKVSRNKVKSYYKVKSNPDLLRTFHIDEKIHPNTKLKKAYYNRKGTISNFEDLILDLGSNAKNAEIEISLNGSRKVKIPLIDFLGKFKLIHSEEGEGLFIEGGRIIVSIGNKEIRRDWWIKHSFCLDDKRGK